MARGGCGRPQAHAGSVGAGHEGCIRRRRARAAAGARVPPPIYAPSPGAWSRSTWGGEPRGGVPAAARARQARARAAAARARAPRGRRASRGRRGAPPTSMTRRRARGGVGGGGGPLRPARRAAAARCRGEEAEGGAAEEPDDGCTVGGRLSGCAARESALMCKNWNLGVLQKRYRLGGDPGDLHGEREQPALRRDRKCRVTMVEQKHPSTAARATCCAVQLHGVGASCTSSRLGALAWSSSLRVGKIKVEGAARTAQMLRLRNTIFNSRLGAAYAKAVATSTKLATRSRARACPSATARSAPRAPRRRRRRAQLHLRAARARARAALYAARKYDLPAARDLPMPRPAYSNGADGGGAERVRARPTRPRGSSASSRVRARRMRRRGAGAADARMASSCCAAPSTPRRRPSSSPSSRASRPGDNEAVRERAVRRAHRVPARADDDPAAVRQLHRDGARRASPPTSRPR